MPTLDEIRERFANDRFATEAAGALIEIAEPNHAVCTMELKAEHCNAAGIPMGGALFTLADFTFAVAANGHSEFLTVSQSAEIHFLSAAKGRNLRAEAKCIKGGKTTSLFVVDIYDELGTHAAYITVAGYTIRK